MKPHQQDSGGGMSRAAKKRAKKKQKKENKGIHNNNQEELSESKDQEELSESKDIRRNEEPMEKTKKRSLEEKNATTTTTTPKDRPQGILKKPKYSNASQKEPAKSSTEEDAGDDDNLQEEGKDLEVSDIVLNEDIQELLKSDGVLLKDMLLLNDKQNKQNKKMGANINNDKKNKEDKSENESEDDNDENPFQTLTSKERARCALNFLLAPSDLSAEDFYEEYWEKKALCVQGTSKSHHHRFDGFLSLKSIQEMTDKNMLYYGRDLNVTKYHTIQPGQPKRRANIDPPPYQDSKTGETKHVQVDSNFVWEQFKEKHATIRLLCPHKHNDSIHALLSLFELEWGCMVGANAYLTPPGGSQGFAPHFDDIEAFCLQLEGKKRWKVYASSKEARLPRVSSEDFTEDDIRELEPVLDVVLEPGDLLYMPRGWIHQGITLPPSQGNEHSLHLTMSAMQQWAWVDYLELLIPEALEAAAMSETSVSLRTGLPRNFLDYMGAMYDQRDDDLPERFREISKDKKKGNEDDDDDEDGDSFKAEQTRRIRKLQERFRNEAKKRIMRVAKEAMDMVDAACDQIGKRFLSDRLPPSLSAQELAYTCECQKDAKIWPSTLCRLARPGIARLVLEDGKAVLYHCNDNSRIYREVPLSPLEFEVDDAPALEQLITTVEPDWIPVTDLIHEGIEDKIAITQSLYDEGILSIMNPNGDASS